MGKDSVNRPPRSFVPGAIIFLAAVSATLPSLHGDFLEGDDRQLILDFVLVSRPSPERAAELLTLGPHRYLYQPVPMLSFAAEFAILDRLGLSPLKDAPNSGIWLFHLTNILIHATNALLVWLLIRGLHPDRRVAWLAGILFAVHPFCVEPTAWLCGRMISLSTLFCLASLLAIERWRIRPTAAMAVIAPVCVILSMTSKAQAALPLLMLLLPAARREKPGRNWWAIWGACTLITIGFVLLNVQLTRQTRLLDVAAESLQGSRLARTVLALGWYLRQLLLPTGLAAFHPADSVVTWSHPGVVPAAILVLLTCAGVLVSLKWSRVGVLGGIWFVAVLGPTLPLMPSRNVIAADRYAYLTSVGAWWALAALASFAVGRLADRSATRMWIARIVGGGLALGLMAASWRFASTYRDDISRDSRTVQVYPSVPGSWLRLARSYQRAGRHEEAILAAKSEIGDRPTTGQALQVIGVSQLRMGHREEALQTLRNAVNTDPSDGKVYFQLARAYEETGNRAEAAANYELAVKLSPDFKPALLALARQYRDTGREPEAVKFYERILADNPYHPDANLAMAEIEIGSRRASDAKVRLERLLSYMPENWTAWTNLGVCQAKLGRPDRAVESYRTALSINPQAEIAALNLAGLLVAAGRGPEAAPILLRALAATPDRPTLWTASDLLVDAGQIAAAGDLWAGLLRRESNAADAKCALAWALLLQQRWDDSRILLNECAGLLADDPILLAVQSMLALVGGDPGPAVKWVESAAQAEDGPLREMLPRMKQAVRSYGETHADQAWPYYLAGRILQIEGDHERGSLLIGEFRRLCSDTSCRKQAEDLGVPF